MKPINRPTSVFLMILSCLVLGLLAFEPPPAALLAIDTDHDRKSDVEEWYSHTSPNDSNSVLRIEKLESIALSNQFKLSWQSVVGRPYEVYWSTNLVSWSSVTSVPSANSTSSSVTRTGSSAHNFYKITTPYDEALAPFITQFSASRTSPMTQASSVRLTLKAYHPSGITSVQMRDGASSLGYATRQSQTEWIFDWLADERNNGSHSFNAIPITPTGVLGSSSTLPFSVSVPTRQHRTISEGFELSATTITESGGIVTASGNVRIGSLTVSGSTTVTWNLDSGFITGNGPLTGPDDLPLKNGAWVIDAARGVLEDVPQPPSPLSLIPGYLVLHLSNSVPIDVSTMPVPGLIVYSLGGLEGNFPDRYPIRNISASGLVQRVEDHSLVLSCEGVATFGSGITGADASIYLFHHFTIGAQPSASFMPITALGILHFPSGSGGPAAVIKGQMEIKLPVTSLDPSFPPLVQGNYSGTTIPVIGTVDEDGSFRPATLPPQPQALLDTLAQWVKLAPDGSPQEGVQVIADALGNLPPCEWRPVLPRVKGSGTIALRFPAGLKMEKPGAETLLKFLHMQLVSAPDCPLQFRQPYEIHGSSTLTLGMDAPTISEILSVLGLSSGFQIRLHNHFDFTLKSGTLNPKGIAGAVLDMTGGLLDLLPDPGQGFPNVIVDLQSPDFTDIPCQWPSSLPAASGGVPIYFSLGNAPACTLRLAADGNLTVHGRAKVKFGTATYGPSFTAEITGDATQLNFELTAEDLDVSLSSAWTLPGAETIDITTPATDTALDPLTRVLRAKINAFERSAVAMIERADQLSASGPLPRPDYADLFRRQGKAALEAFADAKIATPTLPNPANLATSIQQLGRSARTAPSFPAVIDIWFALEKLALAGVVLPSLDTALTEVAVELTDRLDADTKITVTDARRVVAFTKLLIEAGKSDDPNLISRNSRIVESAVSQLQTELQIIINTDLPSARLMLNQNPKVRALQLDEALMTHETLIAIADSIGTDGGISISADGNIVMPTAIFELIIRPLIYLFKQQAIDRLESELAQSSSHGTASETYLRMACDYIKIVTSATAENIQNLETNLPLQELVFANHIEDLGNYAGEWTITLLRNNAEHASTLVEIIRNLPAGITVDASALNDFHTRLKAGFDELWPQLNSLSRDELLSLLESGVKYARLRDELGLDDGSTAWESTQRLSAVVDRLCVLADSASTVEMLDTLKQAGLLLIEEANRFADQTSPNQIKRRFCLVEAEKIAFKMRTVASNWLANNLSPIPLTWGSLLSIENAAAGFRYEVSSRTFSGWASGSFKAPNLGTSLTLKRAQFSTDGSAALEVDAAGLPGFPAFPGTVSLTGSITASGLWSLTASATGNLPKPTSLAWAVPIQNNATLMLDNNRARMTINSTNGPTQATGTITTSYSSGSAVASFSGNLLIEPLTTGIISVLPTTAGATKLILSISSGTTASLSSSKCTLGAPFNVSANLPTLTVDTTYNFSPANTLSPVATTVYGYAWDGFSWGVKRVGSALVIEAPTFTLGVIPGFDPATIQFPADAANTINSNGSFSFGLSGTVPDITIGLIKLNQTAATASISSASGLVLSGGRVGMIDVVTTPAPPALGAPVPYPSLAIPSDPNVNANFITYSCIPTIRGYSFGSSTIRLERSAGKVRLAVTSGTLTLPGGGPSLVSFNGFISSAGEVDLSQDYTGSIYGFPMSKSVSFKMSRGSIGGMQMLIDDGAEALWKLDEILVGASVQDASGKGHIGSVSTQPTVNALPARPGSSSCYSLDGIDDAVTIPDHDNLEGGSAMSVEAWFKVNVLKTGWQTLISKGDNAWRLAINSDDQKLNFDCNSTTSSQYLKSTSTFNDSNWHHVVATYDGTTKRLYIDGTLENSATWSGPIQSNAYAVMIGENAQYLGRKWRGNIDEVAFYRFALSASQVAAHYGGGRPESWWKLDEQILFNPLTVVDSGNGHPGSASGTSVPAIYQPTALSGQNGGAYSFDGTNDTVTIPDHDNLEGGNAMTVSAWFKVNVLKSGWQTIVSKGDNAWRLAIHSDDQKLNFDCNSTTSSHNLKSTSTFNDSNWHHVVATYDGTTKRLYIDGILESSATWNGPIQSNAYAVMIGENAQATGRKWRGNIDEVQFYRRALTSAQALELFESGNGLRLSFEGTADLHSTFRADFAGSISPGGTFDAAVSASATQPIVGPSFTGINLRFRRQQGTTTFVGTGVLSPLPVFGGQAALGGNPTFDIELSRSGANTYAGLSVSGVTVSLCGYSTKGPGFNLSLSGNLGTTPLLYFSGFQFGPFGSSELSEIGFNPLSGNINPATGALAATLSTQSLTLRDMTAPSTTVNFSNSGLSVNANMALKTTISGTTRTWGTVNFSGTIAAAGTYDLAGSGTLTFGGYTTDSFNMRFRSPEQGNTVIPAPSVTPNLNFGTLDMPIAGLSITASALNATMTKTINPSSVNHLDDHLQTTLTSTVTLNYVFSTGSLTGSLSGNWHWQVLDFPVPLGFDSSGDFSISGGINDNGSFTVSNGTASGTYFFAPFWHDGKFDFTPPSLPPYWTFGTWANEPYTLW